MSTKKINRFTDSREKLKKLLLTIDRVKLTVFLTEFSENFGLESLINHLVIPTLRSIGELWENGNLALSQVYMAGRLCEEVVPSLFSEKDGVSEYFPKIGIANLEDHHPFGTQLLYIFLKTRNIDPILYPEGIGVGDLHKRVIEDNIGILLISTLMLRSALKVKELSEKLKEYNRDIKIIVGGAPFNFDSDLWKKVGADAMGKNPFELLEIITPQEV